MNWTKAKSILIVIFLITDIFLAITIYSSEKKATVVPDDVINTSVSLLEKNDIFINKSIISKKNLPLHTVQADNIITDYLEFAEKFLGDELTLSQGTSYTSSVGTVTFWGDNFSFKKNQVNTAKKSLSEQELKKTSNSFLVNCGFNIENAKTTITSNDSSQIIKYNGFLGKTPVFPSEITVEFLNGEIASVSGSWFNTKNDITAQNIELKSAPGILIDFMSLYDGARPCSITALVLGYNIFETNTYHKSATLIPTTKINVSGGKAFYIDSRNSD